MEVAIPAGVVFRDLGGESVLLHLGSGRYYGLNEVGTLIWKSLADGVALSEIEKTILEEYDASPDQVRRDVHGILEELQSQELLELREEGTV